MLKGGSRECPAQCVRFAESEPSTCAEHSTGTHLGMGSEGGGFRVVLLGTVCARSLPLGCSCFEYLRDQLKRGAPHCCCSDQTRAFIANILSDYQGRRHYAPPIKINHTIVDYRHRNYIETSSIHRTRLNRSLVLAR